MLERLRRDGPLLVVDAGNALERPDRFEPPDFLARQEEKLYLRTLTLMGYSLGDVAPAELAYGLDRFREAIRRGRRGSPRDRRPDRARARAVGERRDGASARCPPHDRGSHRDDAAV